MNGAAHIHLGSWQSARARVRSIKRNERSKIPEGGDYRSN
jgi:hypothetical protein